MKDHKIRIKKCEICKKEKRFPLKIKKYGGTPENDGWSNNFYFCGFICFLEYLKNYDWNFTDIYIDIQNCIIYDDEIKEIKKRLEEF